MSEAEVDQGPRPQEQARLCSSSSTLVVSNRLALYLPHPLPQQLNRVWMGPVSLYFSEPSADPPEWAELPGQRHPTLEQVQQEALEAAMLLDVAENFQWERHQVHHLAVEREALAYF